MINSEQIRLGEENFVHDENAARDAAHAEKPARDFIVEHAVELSVGGKQALEWFASTEGEKAVERYNKKKEKINDIVRQNALKMFDVSDMVSGIIDPKGKTYYSGRTQQVSERLVELADKAVELIPIDLILADTNQSHPEKIQKIRNLANNFKKGIWENLFGGRGYPGGRDVNKGDVFSYEIGKILTKISEGNWYEAATEFGRMLKDKSLTIEQFNLIFGKYLDEAHKQPSFDRIMKEHGYVFNPAGYEAVK